MAGYIGAKQGVTQVDGYNRSEADAEFVNDPNDVITVSGSNVGIGTSSNSYTAAGRGNLNIAGSGSAILGFQIGGSAKGYVFHDNTNLQLWNEVSGPILFGTSATTRMTIDSAGRVTMPYQPAFRAQESPSSVGGGSPSGGTAIIYGNVIFNIGGHYNNTNGRFTAPVAGTYYFASAGYWVNDGTRSLAFWKNGVRMNEHYEDLAGNCFCMIYCNAGDYVISSFGAAPANFTGTGNYWSFEGHLIG